MDDVELKKIWNIFDKKLEQSLSLNQKALEEVQKLKAKSVLASSKKYKLFAIVIGILWVLGIDSLIVLFFSPAHVFFVVSALFHVIVTKIAIGIYIFHLHLINQIEYSQSVIEVQEKLAKLQVSMMQVTRLLFVQLPVFTTFYLHEDMLRTGTPALWLLQIATTLLFTYLGIWLFRNIRADNMNKKWFKLIFRDKEWTSVQQAMAFLQEIEAFKQEKE